MKRRLKIKVIAGTLNDSALPRVWEELALRHSVEIFAIDSVESNITTSLPVVMFPRIADMPGFLRNVDRHLAGADLVVGIETSKLYTFQALRASRKLSIPFACVTHEHQPFIYEKYSNIRAIQHDIHHHADVFFPTSRRAEQLLAMEGVPGDKIQRLRATTNPEKFAYSVERAAKFKSYVVLPEDCLLLTLMTSIEDLEPAGTIFQGIRLALNKIRPELRQRIRLLICGEGAASAELKYLVADLGLGPITMILSQDTTPFLGDLLAATDVLIEGRPARKQELEAMPWHVLSAAFSGVKIIVPGGTLADDWLSGLLVSRMDDFSAIDIAISLAEVISNLSRDSGQRHARGELCAAGLSPCIAAGIIQGRLDVLCGHDESSARKLGLVSFVEAHQVPITFKDAKDILVACEEAREFSSTCDVATHSELLRIRGDALAALSRGDEAISSFEESLKSNGMNYHALRGLGYLAWHGHSHEDALSFFKRGLAVNPNDYQCLAGVGLVYRRLKMFDEAVFWLQKAVSIGGLQSPSLSLLVQACLENAETPLALGALLMVRESIGDHPNLAMAIEKLESHQ